MSRRDADRPRVRCTDCRHYTGQRFCLRARKVTFRSLSTCQRFERPPLFKRTSPEPAPPGDAPATLDQARARLAAAGLGAAVSDLALVDSRLAVRFAPGTDAVRMNAVRRALFAVDSEGLSIAGPS
ncbi:MAG: hypothetical protein K9L70_07935 [Thiohalocapsa sp.]|nr:hypothetical protein [Thiohalocapsa sp.]